MPRLRKLLLLGAACSSAVGLNNGLNPTPPMGYSSWFSTNFDVSEDFMKKVCSKLVSSGMAAAGYRYCNVDLGWMDNTKGRDDNGVLMTANWRFPSGMKAIGDYIHSLGLLFGMYTCRGTCQCASGPAGSKGYEEGDVNMIIGLGADWLKVDSCCGSQNHSEAFADYALFRDLLNASGRPVALNLCGWNPWYAPPDPAIGYAGGASLGNSWRIGRDGDIMPWLMENLNAFHTVAQYSGPHGWNDPDNIIGPNTFPNSGISDEQARGQFTVWALLPAPLIVGNDLLKASPHFFETVLNAEVIAVNQDEPFVASARRVVGGDLVYPCAPTAEGPLRCVNVWARPLSGGHAGVVFYNVGGAANSTVDVTCNATCFAAAGLTAASAPHGATARDLWAHAELQTPLAPPYSLTVAVVGDGGARIFRVVPLPSSSAAAGAAAGVAATASSRRTGASVNSLLRQAEEEEAAAAAAGGVAGIGGDSGEAAPFKRLSLVGLAAALTLVGAVLLLLLWRGLICSRDKGAGGARRCCGERRTLRRGDALGDFGDVADGVRNGAASAVSVGDGAAARTTGTAAAGGAGDELLIRRRQ